MSTLLLAAITGGIVTGTVVHYRDRHTTALADQAHYERTRVDVTPVRDIVEDADHHRRRADRAERLLIHRDGVIQALLDELGVWRAAVRTALTWGTTSPPPDPWDNPDPNPMPTIQLWRTW